MAKNIRRMLAMVLVMCMFVSALPMQALAAEGDGVVIEGPVAGTTEEGLATSTTTTTTTTTVDEVKTVVVETVTQTSGTTASGVTVTGSETVTDTTITQNDGATQTTTVGSSEETRQGENLGADVPAVEVPVIPNDTVFESDDATKDVDVKSDAKTEDVGDYGNYDVHQSHYSSTTTTKENVTIEDEDNEEVKEENKTVKTETTTSIDKTTVENYEKDALELRDGDKVIQSQDVYESTDTVVTTKTEVKVTQTTTVLTGDLKENDDDLVYDYTETETTVERNVKTGAKVTVEDESTFDMDQVVAPEMYEGKHYDNGLPALDGNHRHFEGLLNGTNPDNKAPGEKPSEPGYDFVISGSGDATYAAAPVFKNIVYKRDENGNPIPDPENPGKYLIDEEKSSLVYAGDKAGASGMNGTPSQIVVKNKDDELFYTYCIDKGTPTADGSWYKITNLEDSDYYPDDESAAMLRAIVTNGYWGTDANVYETDENGEIRLDENGNKITKKDADGNIVVNENVQGSLASVKALMRETYDENATVTVTDAEGVEYTYKVVDLIDDLKEHEALAVTQAAIWSYSNGSLETMNGQDGVAVVGVQSAVKYYNNNGASPLNQYGQAYNLESDARLKALYDLYMNLEPMESDPETVTTVINEQNSFKDMSFVVNEKVAEKDGKDVYNVDVQFSLDFELDDSQNLKIRLTDADGNNIKDAEGHDIIIEKDLAMYDPDNTETDNSVLRPDKNGVYTLTGLQLSEGTDFSFKLTLDGTQKLEEGVYVYTSHGGQAHSQTLVGLASGTQKVNTSATMNVNFDVKEAQTVTIKHKWSTDPVETPPEEPNTPPEEPNTPPEEPNTPPEEPNTPPEEPVTPPTPPAPPAEPAVVNYYEPPARAAVWTAPENQRLANEEAVEIPEEPVPLATPAITGDDTGLWVMALMMIACCMVAINVFDKKRSHEAF